MSVISNNNEMTVLPRVNWRQIYKTS